MKLTDKLAIMLFDIARDTLNIQANLGGYNAEARLEIINQIMGIQSDKIIDLKPCQEIKDNSERSTEIHSKEK